MAIQFDIPMLFQKEYIDGLKTFNPDELAQIGSVYGSLQKGILGQARHSKRIPQLSYDELAWYVKQIQKLEIEFHYTLNSPWNGMLERDPDQRKNMILVIGEILETGVDALVLANPYLITFVKKNWPDIKLIGSINMQTSTAYKFNKLLEDGCQRIVLDRTVNRNIRFLKQLKGQEQRYSLLVNSTCLNDCPLQQYHANENGALSSGKITEILDTNYCLEYCLSAFGEQTENILKSTWIRPEDISLYETLGVVHLKIQGRTLEPSRLLELVKAYLIRQTPNDSLFYIFPGFEEYFPDLNTKMKNSRLNKIGFVESFFKTERNCAELCLTCNYCNKVLSKL